MYNIVYEKDNHFYLLTEVCYKHEHEAYETMLHLEELYEKPEMSFCDAYDCYMCVVEDFEEGED